MRAAYPVRHFLVFFILSVLLIFLDGQGVLAPLRRGAQTVTLPAKNTLFIFKKSLLSPLQTFSSKQEAGQKIAELEGKIASLSAQLGQKQALERENEELRRLLGAPLSSSWKFAPARVVNKQADILLVTADFAPEAGTPVIIPADRGAIFVGRVEEVLGREAKVVLGTHETSKIPAYAMTADGTKTAAGIVMGDGESAVLDQVLTGEALEQGFLVLTTGETGLPPDLLIGEVEKVIAEESRVWKRAKIKLAMREVSEFVFFLTEY